MTDGLLLGLVFVALLAIGLFLGRRLHRAQSPVLAPPELAEGSDPLLGLALRANGAIGVWVSGAPGEGIRSAVAARLDPDHAALVEARLERLARSADGGTELLLAGTLVSRGDGTRAGAILLPGGVPQTAITAARRDLDTLLARLQREPILAMVGRSQDRPHESAESVSMRLAHQIERLLDTEVAVALARPQGVQVLGVSLRSDPRLLLALAAPGSPLERVGRGIDPGPVVSDDPLGRTSHERRRARPRAVILPIPGTDLPVGAVVAATFDGALPDGAVMGELMQALGAAGPRLAQALDRQELQETVRRDPLTGLRNRRGLDEALARIEHREGALVYADLDHFKRLNDTLGHPAGDAALVHFARVLSQEIRSGDVASRIGGEEFALWLPDATLLEGAAVAERVRAALAAHHWSWQGTEWSLTASFGVAACPETVPSVEHLAARADEALYHAKQAGRDRVVVAM